VQASQSCPQCGASLPVHHGFVTWCGTCSWNLTAPATGARADTRFDRLYSAAGKRLGKHLADQLLAAHSLEPRPTPARVTAYVIAALIHVTTLAFAAGGVLLVVLTFPNVAGIVAGVVLIGLALLMRPRLGKFPRRTFSAERTRLRSTRSSTAWHALSRYRPST
jgi:hypothetical protein